MMDDYNAFRLKIIEFIERDFFGPSEPEEILDDSPISRYISGILFPQLQADEDDSSTDGEDLDVRDKDEEEVGVIGQTSSFFPSAMGLSFMVGQEAKQINCLLEYGKYQKIDQSEYDLISISIPDFPIKSIDSPAFNRCVTVSNDQIKLKTSISKQERDEIVHELNNLGIDKKFISLIYRLYDKLHSGWKRIPCQHKINIDISKALNKISVPDENNLQLCIVTKEIPKISGRMCTLSLTNNIKTNQIKSDVTNTFFQVSIRLSGQKGQFLDLTNAAKLSQDEEELSLGLLYLEKKYYSSGHGTSVGWAGENISESSANEIFTRPIPSYELPQMNLDSMAHESLEELPQLDMHFYGTSDQEAIVNQLKKITRLYSSWIDRIEKEIGRYDSRYQAVAKKHIDRCRKSASRMNAGIASLANDGMAFKAFQLANRAMLMQRSHTKLQSQRKSISEQTSMPNDYSSIEAKWRPFQIAFILLALESIIHKESEYRDFVDLIWFPTGGGKTEAYLGVTAFTIFFRRLSNNPEISGGTTVIMRYTLRLLTSQQFQRACTLICACEKLREKEVLGDSPISIGLWLGGSSTPNTIDDAEERIAQLFRLGNDAPNPFQVLFCPWCGTPMTRIRGEGSNCYRIKSKPHKYFSMWCQNQNCDFNRELPIKIIDEDIYHDPPTLLFGTVDKFAMMPWKEEIANIFALDGSNTLSPELIIQDELHLISGALGTVVGAYESAIDILCSAKGIKPKIIASTATIRRAAEQCRALYGRDTMQFPSPGIDAKDSFFAVEANTQDKPGRIYIGVMPSGNTSTTMQVRLIANLMQGVKLIDASPEVKDKFWTQVIYCNSIRELGTSKSIVNDDVKQYSSALVDRNADRSQLRYYSDSEVVELTSRVSAEGIPAILNNLNIPYNDGKSNPIEVLLATNMISVGVDIDRLGLMTVLGQPKTTSEYIQASSRVGRKYPGLVITLYSPVKSRDRSHYERFQEYHQSIYRFVEPTSVTPFSSPARDKTLPSIIISLLRHYLGFHKNQDIPKIVIEPEKISNMAQVLIERIKKSDSSELESTVYDIEKIVDNIKTICSANDGVAYSSAGRDKDKRLLMKRVGDDSRDAFYEVPQSMRNADSEVFISVDYNS